MRFLLFSFGLLLISCASHYKELKPSSFDKTCLEKVIPGLVHTQLYDAGIDVMGKHISGLLLVKTLEDGSKRAVFTNEAGIKFLDFGWSADQTFRQYFVMKQLNKDAVVNMLRRDFELLIGYFYQYPRWTAWETDSEHFMATPYRQDRFFVVTDKACTKLLRGEFGSKKKKILSISYPDSDNVVIKHYTFDMQIMLKKIDKG
jgi:hypothetical protein